MSSPHTTRCEGCAYPAGGLYIAGCRPCTLRSIARSQEHYASRMAGRMTPGYKSLLQALGPIDAVHVEVKAVFQALGRVQA